MANMCDSGLFSELEDLIGHDPTFYEEPDVSSLHGDIRKHSYITTSPYDNELHPEGVTKVLEPLSSTPSNPVGEMESLLSEGNMLLDRLMAENGLDLLTAPVELADVDELIAGEAKFNSSVLDTQPSSSIFAHFYEPADETCQVIPESPVSTLPSEPSSPVDWFDLQSAVAAAAAPASPVVGGSGDGCAVDELDDLLSSLLDEGTEPQSSEDYLYDNQSAYSPASSSSASDYGYYGQASDVTEEDISLSSYSGSPAPAKSKTTKKKKSSTPYSKLPANRKEKKKLQNKEAAIRYRQKKKGETQVLADEEAQLQEKNDTLRAEVLNLEREILCMKELLSDVFNVHSI